MRCMDALYPTWKLPLLQRCCKDGIVHVLEQHFFSPRLLEWASGARNIEARDQEGAKSSEGDRNQLDVRGQDSTKDQNGAPEVRRAPGARRAPSTTLMPVPR